MVDMYKIMLLYKHYLSLCLVMIGFAYIFALVTKQVTIKVAAKVRTNLLCCKWYLTSGQEKRRELYKTMAH